MYSLLLKCFWRSSASSAHTTLLNEIQKANDTHISLNADDNDTTTCGRRHFVAIHWHSNSSHTCIYMSVHVFRLCAHKFRGSICLGFANAIMNQLFCECRWKFNVSFTMNAFSSAIRTLWMRISWHLFNYKRTVALVCYKSIDYLQWLWITVT